MISPSNSMLRPKALLATAGLVALGFCSTQASAQTQNFTIAQQTTDFNQAFTFNQFDPTLGTLDSVELVLNSTGNFSGTVGNNAAGPETFTVSENGGITFTGPDSTSANAPLSASQTYTALAPGASAPFGPFSPSNTGTAFVPVADFAAYIGPGTSDLTFATLTGESITGGGGNIASNIQTTAGGTASLIYTYSPSAVPEPATIVPFALGGLALLGLVIRKTRHSSTPAA